MIAVIYGTRPEAIKLGPVVAELRATNTRVKVVCTGQHTDLLRGTPAELDLAEQGSVSIGLASSGDILKWLRRAERLCKEAILGADLVVVQGDTMSALAGTRAAVALSLPLAHVEAGIRSHHLDEPWPEEGFRVEIDRQADWHYAPTTACYANLLAEGVRPERVRVTGNSIVSAMARYTGVGPRSPSDHAIVTLHRREWMLGNHFQDVLDGLATAVAEHPAARWLWPMHPAIAVKAARWLQGPLPPNLAILKPLAYRDAVLTLAHSFGVLTDSGGLQEEAATLGVPCAVVRNVTDRPESIEAGVARQFDVTGDGVRGAVLALATGQLPRRPSPVFGDVTAASTIAAHLSSLAPEE